MKQREFILSRLKENGEVTRNECLRNYISRLASRIHELREEGFEFETFYRPVLDDDGNKIGQDYVYKVIKTPKEFKWK